MTSILETSNPESNLCKFWRACESIQTNFPSFLYTTNQAKPFLKYLYNKMNIFTNCFMPQKTMRSILLQNRYSFSFVYRTAEFIWKSNFVCKTLLSSNFPKCTRHIHAVRSAALIYGIESNCPKLIIINNNKNFVLVYCNLTAVGVIV